MEETNFLYLVTTAATFYLIGFFVGLMRNMDKVATHILKEQPIVIRVEKVHQKFLAYMILNHNKNIFVEQGVSIEEIVDRLRKKHPEKTIIVAEAV